MITGRVTGGLNFRSSPSATSNANLLPPPLVAGDQVQGSEIVPAADGGKWLHVLIVNNISREGYVASWLLADLVIPPPPATVSEIDHIQVYFKDGTTQTFVPE